MAEVRLSPAAYADLKTIAAYTAKKWGADQRTRYLVKFDKIFIRLAEQPAMGRPRDALRPGYRSVSVGRHVVFYRILPDGVEVVRILHESMDFSRRLR
ncbi:MAG: type II toxin-antitoxin system RelE/ParE family toxin [Alphaproteobacteria bacterium]|nr:type II toxin-antitoxin system RelE/ParE family toxin [Alphaproteobacteria bacterium]